MQAAMRGCQPRTADHRPAVYLFQQRPRIIDMTSFATLISAARQADGSFAFDLPDGWRQGRTAYGGLTVAVAHETARGLDAQLPGLRSAQIAFVGPVGVNLHISAAILRRGKSSAFIETRVTSDGELAMLGTFLFMAGRASPIALAAPTAPAAPSPEEAEPAMRGKGAAFTSQLEYRHALSPRDRGKPILLRWVRLRERAGIHPVTELLLVADALPPGLSPVIQGPFMASSANWTVHLHGADFVTTDGWWLVQSKAESASSGISSQQMSIWNRAGDAVLSGSQTVSFSVVAG